MMGEFIGSEKENMKSSKLDYTKIKEEFSKANKQFALKDEECIGL